VRPAVTMASARQSVISCTVVLLLLKVADPSWCLKIIMRLLVIIIVHPFVGLLPTAYFGTKTSK